MCATHYSFPIQYKIHRHQYPKHRVQNFGNLETMMLNQLDLCGHRHRCCRPHFSATFLHFLFWDLVVRALSVHYVSKKSFLDHCYPSQYHSEQTKTKNYTRTHARNHTRTQISTTTRFNFVAI